MLRMGYASSNSAAWQYAKSAALALAIMLAVFTTRPAEAQSFKILYAFTGGTDGGSPQSAVIQDKAGNLYGTTYAGGSHQAGTIYELSLGGKETVLYSFNGATDSGFPYAALTMDTAGNFYGVAEGGEGAQEGTAFKLDTQRHFTVLHTFVGSPNDGESPWSNLILDPAGNLYGVTEGGGTFQNGIVYKIDTSGNFSVLHNFAGEPDGNSPYGALVMDSTGALYGTSRHGGSAQRGAVFKIDSAGNESVMASFVGGEGDSPMAGMIEDSAGNFYGTLLSGGDDDNGEVFKMDPTGKITTFYEFGGGKRGVNPYGALVMDSAGNLYGTTFQGGLYQYGEVFKFDTSGNATVLHSFSGKDGAFPYAGLYIDAAGTLYGTTTAGGPNGAGVVYKITLTK